MSLRTLLLLIFTFLYFVFGHWFYTQKISDICCSSTTTTATGADTPAIVETPSTEVNDILSPGDVGPLTFNWSDEEAITADDFEDYKASILRNLTDDNVLEITGHYFSNEATPDGYENMGFARAEAIRDLFADMIPEDRIIINSKLVDDMDDMEVNPFEAAEFNWIAPINSNKTTIAEIDDRTLIFFPFNSKIKDTNKEVDDYLSILADRIKDTGESVLIVGHTDSTGDAKYNYDLGLQRAIYIRNILVSMGANRSLISVDSKGETQPIASNRTRAGEHKNRRVVINLNKN